MCNVIYICFWFGYRPIQIWKFSSFLVNQYIRSWLLGSCLPMYNGQITVASRSTFNWSWNTLMFQMPNPPRQSWQTNQTVVLKLPEMKPGNDWWLLRKPWDSERAPKQKMSSLYRDYKISHKEHFYCWDDYHAIRLIIQVIIEKVMLVRFFFHINRQFIIIILVSLFLLFFHIHLYLCIFILSLWSWLVYFSFACMFITFALYTLKMLHISLLQGITHFSEIGRASCRERV